MNSSPAFRCKSSVTAGGVYNRRQGHCGLSTAIGCRGRAVVMLSAFKNRKLLAVVVKIQWAKTDFKVTCLPAKGGNKNFMLWK